jgi:hypothetical protein
MVQIKKPAGVDLKKQYDLNKDIEAFARCNDMHWNIKRLLKEAKDAKDNGEWEKARAILYKLRYITRDNIETTM